MTNYERIKNMTDEEMAEELLSFVIDCQIDCEGVSNPHCEKCIKDWLNKESEES